MPNFEFPELCEHGNLKEMCEICRNKRKPEASAEESIKNTPTTIGNQDAQVEKSEYKDFDEAEIEEVPEIWMTNSGLSKSLGRDFYTIRKIAERYRDSHPEWFRQKTDSKRGGELFSPELVRAIRQELNVPFATEGWLPNTSVAKELEASPEFIAKVGDKYREAHPEWFEMLTSPSRGMVFEHYSPELIDALKRELSEIAEAPEGWYTIRSAAQFIELGRRYIQDRLPELRESHPEWFRIYRDSMNRPQEHIFVALLEHLKDQHASIEVAFDKWQTNLAVAKKLNLDGISVKRAADKYRVSNPEWFKVLRTERGLEYEHYAPELIQLLTDLQARVTEAPANWKNATDLMRELGVVHSVILKRVAKYREDHPDWFLTNQESINQQIEYYSPELCSLIKHEIESVPFATDDWVTVAPLSRDMGFSTGTIARSAENFRAAHPEWFKVMRTKQGLPYEHYSRELCDAIRDDLAKVSSAPTYWITTGKAEKLLHKSSSWIENRLPTYRESHPDWFEIYRESESGRIAEHLSPELISELERLKAKEPPGAPDHWFTRGGLSKLLNVGIDVIQAISNQYRESNPEWFREYLDSSGKPAEHYSSELVALVTQMIENKGSSSEQDAEDFIQKIAVESSHEAEQFRALITTFGSSRAVDILYRMHPSFRGVPVDHVRGMLADYLGDFLLVQADIDIAKIEKIVDLSEYLTDEDLRSAFLEVVKDSYLSYFQEQRRHGRDQDPRATINEYFAQLRGQVAQLPGINLTEMIDGAVEYYTALYEGIEKPQHIVDQLREGRTFPDINQLINIKEIADKRKMLIADEMGLGKSASAILSKEILGVRCALIVAPSNVIPTWQRYLSDEINGDGRQMGYFKPGKAPRVLAVDKVEDLRDIDTGSYDYVLLSQERLNKRYMAALKALDYDMLVVDEVHKLKNITEGERSQNIIDLARRIEGDDQYLVMLSGTPVPNKVMDVALILKMLYPEKFGQIKNEDLVRSIMHGDIVDARNLLVPRMQIKRLQESIEMPPLTETTVSVTLSKEEEEIYSVLYEDDELIPQEKIAAMRKFLLNPDLLRVSPKVESSKIKALDHELGTAFVEHGSVVVFVNSFIEDVIRGENAILAKLSVPEGAEVAVIDASTSKAERAAIQKKLNHTDDKMLVLVSGQTADVGVDFSGADHVIFYNEPWTVFDKEQQLARVYREGHTTPLESKTIIVEKTIEEGIHHFIDAKKKAVEKLLRGVPLTELEIQILEEDEKSEPGKEFNPRLAEYYFSHWDRMMKIFSHMREIGEDKLKRFLDRHGEDYANCYAELGSRAYQANNARVVTSIILEMIRSRGGLAQELRFLDIASGPEMLKQHMPEDSQDSVISVDINPHHFDEGPGQKVVSSFSRLPFKDNSMDYCNLALALHYTQFIPSRNEYERLQVLTEMNRVLKVGGRGVISMIFNIDFKDEGAARALIGDLGFTIVEEYSGEAEGGNNYRSHVFTMEKVADIPEMQEVKDVEALAERIGKPTLEGLKLKKNKITRLRDSRRVINAVRLSTREGSKDINLQFNERDRRIFAEEQDTLREGHILKSKYRRIEDIPEEELEKQGFSRLLPSKRYLLLKLFKRGEGAVVIR